MPIQEHVFDIPILLGFGRGCAGAVHFALVLLHDIVMILSTLTDAFL